MHSTKLLQTLPQENFAIVRKSYEVGISPKINLCNSVEVAIDQFIQGQSYYGRQV